LGRHIELGGNFLWFLGAVVISNFCLEDDATGPANLAEQVFRRVARFDSPLVNDDHATARHLDLREYVGRKQNSMLFTEVFDQLADLSDLIWIETDCVVVENVKLVFV